MRRFGALVAGMVALVVLSASAAMAALTLEIPINTRVDAEPGSITELSEIDTPIEFIGATCEAAAVAQNGSSVHPNNDLLIESGGDVIVLADVERASGAVTESSGELTLGPIVKVSLRMGSDGIFSGGMAVVVGDTCSTPPTTTSTTTTSTTTSTTTTSTTTMPLPGGSIDIVKDATPTEISDAGVATFTITVTNDGPVPLTDVHVTDDVAAAIDAGTDCVQPSLPDLDPGESTSYQCTVEGLATNAPWTNEATSIGTPPTGPNVTDTDTATVLPQVEATTITQAPSTTTEAPPETLPNTGPSDGVRDFAVVGMLFFIAGGALLGGAALIGRLREQR